LAAQDSEQMDALRSPAFVLDYVYADAFERRPLSAEETKEFWPAWFAGFPEMDLEVTRTIAAETVVVTQWVFTGTNTGLLEPAALGRRVEPTGRTIQFRGVSIYDIGGGLIQRETLYMDFATLWVELGVEL
jgi:predicted ester cyclase